jgi:hypothetical protein
LGVRLSLLCWGAPDPSRTIMAVDLLAAGGEVAPAVFAITVLEQRRYPGDR